MREIESALKEIGERNGFAIAFDENGACTLELEDGRVMLLQERADLNELDFVATLGPVPEEARAEEVVIAAFLAKFDVPGNQPDLPAQGGDGKTTVDLNMTSVSLLTPGIGRHWYARGSGKDRTGQMDVECKFLATLIARGEPIPEPGARLTKEQQALLRSIALEGGNFEVQKMNTAIAGFKTGSVNSVTERLGGSEYREFHRGGSDHVNV